MTHPNRFAREVETTTTLAAVPPAGTYPPGAIAAPELTPEEWEDFKMQRGQFAPATLSPQPEAMLRRVDFATSPEHSSPALTPVPGPLPAGDPAWRTENLSPDAATLHSLACACEWGGDVEGHGVDFEDLAGAWRRRVLEQAVAAGEVVPAGQIVPARYPIEAKVRAGGKGALLAGAVVGVLTWLSSHLGAIGSLYGGQFPWLGGVLAVAAVVLPAAIGTWQGYDAPHTPRAGGLLPRSSEQ